jgi:hypothetical protein
MVTIIGSPNAIEKALHSTQSIRRNTLLAERLRDAFHFENDILQEYT